MKKLNKNSILLTAAFLFAPLAMAQTTTGIGYDKTVKQTGDKEYEITMTAFTTGQVITTVDTITKPCDIALVLDYSNSMSTHVTTTTETINELSASQRLSYNNNNYRITVNGQELYLRGSRENVGTNSRPAYTYRYYYGPDNNPTNDGTAPIYTSEGWYNSRTDYGSGSEPTVQQILDAVSGATRIYTISQSTTDLGSRLELMLAAAQEFVETVYSRNPKTGDKHRVGVIGFAGNVWTLHSLQELTDEDVKDEVKYSIVDLGEQHGTYSYLGLGAAYDMLNNNNNHQLVTVFFTDGQPNGNENNNQYYGFGQYTREAVRHADELKALATEDRSSVVYSVALLSASDANDTRMMHFLNYVSSNYTTGMTDNANYDFRTDYPGTNGGSEGPHDYFQLSSGSDLTSIFQSIASSASDASSSTALSETSVVAVDVISHSFKLPDNANTNDIKVYVAPFTGIAADNAINPETGEAYTAEEKARLLHYQFGEAVPFETALAYTGTGGQPKPIVPAYEPLMNGNDTVKDDQGHVVYSDVMIVPKATIDSNNRQKISVTGFNYGGNPVGFEVINHEQTNNPVGYELVIKVPIVVDPANPGGANVETNDEGSGIYINGSDKPLVEFPKPTVTLPNIIVRKYGLDRVHESASFKLEKMNDDGSAVDTRVKPYFFIVTHENSRRGFDFAQIKLQEPGTYRVTETDWSWNYTTTVSKDNLTGPTISPTAGGNVSQNYMIRTIGAATEQEDTATGLKGAIFDFKNTKNTPEISVSNYNESNKVNIFPTKSVSK